jgi:hypothetical protein
MLAAIGTQEILKSEEYIFEPKLDGYGSYHEITGILPLSSQNSRLAISLRPIAHLTARLLSMMKKETHHSL